MAGRSIGQRDRMVTIQKRVASDAATDSGMPTETWTTLNRVWMARKDSRQDESFRADQTGASFDTSWEMPYLSSMDPELVDVPKLRRLLANGRPHDITGARVMDFEDGKAIELLTLAATGI